MVDRGAVGRQLHGNVRGELEFAFRSNTADQWSVNGVAGDWTGHVFGYSGMANAYYDFRQFGFGLTPYVGGGIGFAVLDGDFRTAVTRIEIDDTAFAYQLIVGGSKALHRGIDIFAEYRFFGTSNVDVVNAGVTPSVVLERHEAEIDNVFFGLRLRR